MALDVPRHNLSETTLLMSLTRFFALSARAAKHGQPSLQHQVEAKETVGLDELGRDTDRFWAWR